MCSVTKWRKLSSLNINFFKKKSWICSLTWQGEHQGIQHYQVVHIWDLDDRKGLWCHLIPEGVGVVQPCAPCALVFFTTHRRSSRIWSLLVWKVAEWHTIIQQVWTINTSAFTYLFIFSFVYSQIASMITDCITWEVLVSLFSFTLFYNLRHKEHISLWRELLVLNYIYLQNNSETWRSSHKIVAVSSQR